MTLGKQCCDRIKKKNIEKQKERKGKYRLGLK